MRLTWHAYNYYPYERELAAREVASLFGRNDLQEVNGGIELCGNIDSYAVGRLTYFSGSLNDRGFVPTVQAKLEQAARNGKRKQATRYSVHGLHEYKGKFNPQVVRALLNIFGIEPGQHILDPFCGSGTTLVECAHYGSIGVGTDINPLAIAIARAKIQALDTPSVHLSALYQRVSGVLLDPSQSSPQRREDSRTAFLESWFDLDVLDEIERVRSAIEDVSAEMRLVFLIIASNLLRDYSLQDPNDLRTRRRKSPLPEKSFISAFLEAVPPQIERIREAQSVLGIDLPQANALLHDVKEIALENLGGPFDAAITSPPYAMALPYIDTQRLSLVWLGFCQPSQVLPLESELIGSREMRGVSRKVLLQRLKDNADNLPATQHLFCAKLHDGLGETDGFRRKAVPTLLYRYFVSMKDSFRAVRMAMKRNAPYALIVGHNHTTIGGVRRDIDTPSHLANLAAAEGWQVEEYIPLQTYHRYGYHVGNAVAAETLIVLRNS